jgi:hypothetical protein
LRQDHRFPRINHSVLRKIPIETEPLHFSFASLAPRVVRLLALFAFEAALDSADKADSITFLELSRSFAGSRFHDCSCTFVANGDRILS